MVNCSKGFNYCCIELTNDAVSPDTSPSSSVNDNRKIKAEPQKSVSEAAVRGVIASYDNCIACGDFVKISNSNVR